MVIDTPSGDEPPTCILTPDLPTVTVSPRGAERIRAGHPWVARRDLVSDAAGEVVLVRDRRGTLLGTALSSAAAPIALRMLGREALRLDRDLLGARIDAAIARRATLAAAAGWDAYRLVHGEADLLPGLFIDRYADVAVIQTACAAMDRREKELADLLMERLGVRLVVARDDGGARDFEQLPRRKGVLAGGGPTRVEFHDAGSAMIADVLADGKTGGFLDQQENHARAASYVRAGDEALDAFCYHGGFALALARAGARVTALDESAPAIDRLQANAAANAVTVESLCDNAFDALRRFDGESRRFDLVVIDPPALAKRKGVLATAERAYKELTLRGLRILRPGGILVTCSCSARLVPERFGAIIESAAADAGRAVQLLERRGASRDHPVLVTVPETEYLKVWVMRVLA